MSRQEIIKEQIREILKGTAFTYEEVTSKRRTEALTCVRHWAMSEMCKRYPHYSDGELGLAFNRDRTVVIYARKKFRDLQKT